MASLTRSVRSLILLALLACVGALPACNSDSGGSPNAATSPAGLELVPVTIAGQKFDLELAIKDDVIFKGLGSRESVPERGGMLFVFPDVQQRNFLMRDCLVDIDIMFLSPSGRVVAMHTMPAEPPRAENEGNVGQDQFQSTGSERYHQRLPLYPSRFPAQFAIELKAGTMKQLGVKEGDQIDFDVEGLKTRARNADSR